MAKERTIPWYRIDEVIPDLETDVEHKIQVQREAIPLIFIPGIMGTRLRLSGTDGTGKNADGYPNMRWDPSDKKWMWWYFSGKEPEWRKAMLVGESFDDGYLEVANTDP